MDPKVWLSPRALRLHAVIIVVVPAFMALCFWQLDRALSGNELSWAYVFEWPFFAGYAVYMWWRLVHEAPDAPEASEAAAASEAPEAAEASAAPQAAEASAAPQAAEASAAPQAAAAPDPDPAVAAARAAEDAELAAYNEYLSRLAARDEAAGR